MPSPLTLAEPRRAVMSGESTGSGVTTHGGNHRRDHDGPRKPIALEMPMAGEVDRRASMIEGFRPPRPTVASTGN
jgi:hypothetical protein